jgi:uncharacterized Tic20 family protein
MSDEIKVGVRDAGTTEWGQPANSDERLFSLIAHLLTFVVPVIGPLVVYLVKKDSSKFVSYHAMQALVAQLAFWIIGGFTCGLGILAGYVFGVLAALKANSGEWAAYPVIESVGR